MQSRMPGMPALGGCPGFPNVQNNIRGLLRPIALEQWRPVF
jgi:hypothetical protein